LRDVHAQGAQAVAARFPAAAPAVIELTERERRGLIEDEASYLELTRPP
jgi:hypothetical protein